MQSGYSKCTYSFIDQRLFAPAWRWPDYVRQVHATPSCSSMLYSWLTCSVIRAVINRYDHNYMRTGLEVRACTASLPPVTKRNSFLKLVCVCKRIFMRKTFVVQCHPQNIFNIKLFPNYGIYCLASSHWQPTWSLFYGNHLYNSNSILPMDKNNMTILLLKSI